MENQKPHKPGVMQGRLCNEFQGGHGKRYHAVPLEEGETQETKISYTKRKAMCGAKPGPRSVGWATEDKGAEVNCPRCLKKLEKV